MPRALVLWGVSAGATLAALTGLRRADVRGVVDWFGPADLFAMAEHDMGEAPEDTREARWIGAPANRAARMPRAGPARRCRRVRARRRSTSPTEPADEHVPFAQSEALAEALRAVGVEVEFHPVQGGRHFWQGLADTDLDAVFDRAIDFVRRASN